MFTATGAFILGIVATLLTAIYYLGKIVFGLRDRRRERKEGKQ